MTDQNARPYAAFRLNLEQQQKRAKDLLKSAKAGESATLRRLQGAGFTNQKPIKLADAQHCIARELRFTSWAALKRHIGAMEGASASLGAAVLDGDCRTMHIGCGHDIERDAAVLEGCRDEERRLAGRALEHGHAATAGPRCRGTITIPCRGSATWAMTWHGR